MLPPLLFLLAAAHGANAAPVHDGGVCAGLSWVRLRPGEEASLLEGPDFVVLRFHGPAGPQDHEWGLYEGNFAQAKPGGAPFLQRDGVIVRRAMESGKFNGYLAEKDGLQNHFFGAVFTGTDADRGFFDRIDFGPKGQTLCAKRK